MNTMTKTAWTLVGTLLIPPWIFLCLVCYWYFFDNTIPMTINYSSPTFTSIPTKNREEAKKFSITETNPGTIVWTYRELCVNPPFNQGILRQSWDGEGFSWTLPDTKFITDQGCKVVSYAVETPKLGFTRRVVYNSMREFEINPLKDVGVLAPPISIMIIGDTTHKKKE